MPSDSTVGWRSIDDILGPRQRRFFGEGYTRVEQRLTGVTVSREGGLGEVTARASLDYPADWSRKGGMDLRPHLSTIDTVVIATRLAEVYLTRALGLDAGALGQAWLRGFTMRAGMAPQEDLSDFAVHATATPPRPETAALGGYVTELVCAVGAIRIRCEIEHGPAAPADTAWRFANLADALGRDETDQPHRRRRHRIGDVAVAPSGGVTARVTVDDRDGDAAPAGLGSWYEPALSAVDCLVCVAQLAQVAMYDLDDIDRRVSETLWMRSVWLTSRTPFQPMGLPFAASLDVSRSKLLRHDGALWRTADVAGTFKGMRVGSSLAHRLPDLAAACGGAA